MEKLNFNIFHALNSHFEVSVSGPTGSSSFHKVSSFVEFPSAPLWFYLISSLLKTLRLARSERPNIVFCGSGAAILAGYFSAKLTGAKLVCYLHGLDIVAKSIVYQLIFIPLIKKSDLLLVNSRHTCNLALRAGFDSGRIKILSPGTFIPEHTDSLHLKRSFCKKYKLQDVPFLLIAGRITKRKGIEEFIVHVMQKLVSQHPELTLVVIGDEALQAIKQHDGVKEKIVQRVYALGLQDNVRFLGGVDDQTLSAAFFSAKMLVFPVLDLANDVEGFGMVAIEAAAHGLCSVGFSVGGVPDAISTEKSGWLVEPGHYDEMRDVILDKLKVNSLDKITSETCIDFAREFEWKKFNEKLYAVLNEETV
ncbi:glycoside hydrolase [Cellvibrio zantedeschiae]|uniref:Glycoside hydrolase n=2 Tax=Cellvibrio zantedeschiae TaxID=1237077 RepID=A0ABQ3APV5_9GAMM|nr:glycoside hydrolase [Cellvibrio zantedeschiae]